MSSTEASTQATITRKRRWRVILISLTPVAVIVGVYAYIVSGRYQGTDDAYTQAGTVSVSSNIPGRVVEIAVRDNQIVHRGDLLYRLDEHPYRIAVDAASARLAAVKLQIASLKATYRQRQTELKSAQENLSFAQTQFDRNKRLLSSGIASQAQYDQAQNALNVAQQQVASVDQQIDVAIANLGGSPNVEPDDHPLVKQAQADLDRAKLEFSYTTITASIDGIVSQVERLQIGDYVAASAPVFSLVSTQNVWIEANFKEVQLARMHAGQKATVKIDRFPGKQFSARVLSLSPTTGAQSSLLPPENATGNWVKVVQRVPVRLEIIEGDAGTHLQAGLSAYVSVDTETRAEEVGPKAAQNEMNGGQPKVARP
jgi:membrane fusion protein (multidrug efflux system)